MRLQPPGDGVLGHRALWLQRVVLDSPELIVREQPRGVEQAAASA
jgi:hypothetical protein